MFLYLVLEATDATTCHQPQLRQTTIEICQKPTTPLRFSQSLPPHSRSNHTTTSRIINTINPLQELMLDTTYHRHEPSTMEIVYPHYPRTHKVKGLVRMMQKSIYPSYMNCNVFSTHTPTCGSEPHTSSAETSGGMFPFLL